MCPAAAPGIPGPRPRPAPLLAAPARYWRLSRPSPAGPSLPRPQAYAYLATASGVWTRATAPAFSFSVPTGPTPVPDVLSDWTWTGSAGVQHSCTLTTVAACNSAYQPNVWGGLPAAEGFVYGVLPGTSSMSQTLTGLVPFASYRLSFMYNAQPTTAIFVGAAFNAAGDGNALTVTVRRAPRGLA